MDLNQNDSIILFDGVCNFCDKTIQLILKLDKNAHFKFAPLQSNIGQSLLKKFDIPSNSFDSIFLIESGKIYQKSTAALRILWGIGGIWSLAYVLLLIPLPLRDFIYGVVAKNRYRFLGKQSHCILPTPQMRARFLE